MSSLLPPSASPDPNRDAEAAFPLAAYKSLEKEELIDRIQAVRDELGDSLLILGHHYQQDEVVEHTDIRGDSYQLSQMASESK
ncbi:MAG: quinolinate synthase NadA, partial [Planctomycetota bacterium]